MGVLLQYRNPKINILPLSLLQSCKYDDFFCSVGKKQRCDTRYGQCKSLFGRTDNKRTGQKPYAPDLSMRGHRIKYDTVMAIYLNYDGTGRFSISCFKPTRGLGSLCLRPGSSECLPRSRTLMPQ